MKKILTLMFIWAGLVSGFTAQSQTKPDELSGRLNVISPAVPFLTIAPDSRAGAMGDAGVATTPDASSQHWNPAKYPFVEGNFGGSFSYTPWLRELVDDMNLAYLSGYYRFGKEGNQVVSASLRYFDLGSIQFVAEDESPLGIQNPNEFAFDVAYSRKLSQRWSGAVAFRFIRSDLTGGQSAGVLETHAGTSFAADVAAYYQNDEMTLGTMPSTLSFGVNVSNIGSKISYSDNEEEFIPTNLRLGTALKMDLDDYNSLQVTVDMNKLLVPTPDGDAKDLGDKSVLSGVFSSFGDAPGGFKEEVKEIMWSLGAEYLYKENFAVRGGYFHEHETKGNRKYFSTGLGFKMNVLSMDLSYLIPTGQNSPLANTLRFTIAVNMK